MKTLRTLVIACVVLGLTGIFPTTALADAKFPCSIEGTYSVVNGVVTNTSSCIGKVVVDSSATSIGDRAFTNNIGISEVVLPPSVSSIGSTAFAFASNLSSVTLTSSISSIPDYAFSQDTALKKIIIPDSVINIGQSAFEGDSSLTEIQMSKHLSTLGSNAFAGTTSLGSLEIPLGVLTINDNTFRGSGIKIVTLPTSVIMISPSAFLQTNVKTLNYCGGSINLPITPTCSSALSDQSSSPVPSSPSQVVSPGSDCPPPNSNFGPFYCSLKTELIEASQYKLLILQQIAKGGNLDFSIFHLSETKSAKGIASAISIEKELISSDAQSFAEDSAAWDSAVWATLGATRQVTLNALVNAYKASSKTTITCIRAKAIKKVTGVKPVCPKGYKKK